MMQGTGRVPRITVKYNESVVKEIELTGQELTIGRKADNDLVLEDGSVSSRHARLVKIQSVFFLEDLQSTNGTFVNEKRIDRQQLKDGDIAVIGKHRLVFRDETAEVSHGKRSEVANGDRTVILKSPKTADGPHRESHVGMLHVVSGKTDRKEYTLTNKLTIIGSQANAAVKLGGWFAPKVAAMIGRRGDGYYISPSEEGKALQVNHATVKEQTDLKEGDVIEVAGVKMYFSMKDGSSS